MSIRAVVDYLLPGRVVCFFTPFKLNVVSSLIDGLLSQSAVPGTGRKHQRRIIVKAWAASGVNQHDRGAVYHMYAHQPVCYRLEKSSSLVPARRYCNVDRKWYRQDVNIDVG